MSHLVKSSQSANEKNRKEEWYTDLTKQLHYVALHKHIFIHGHFYTNFEVKGFMFGLSLPSKLHGASGIRLPHCLSIGQLPSCCICHIFIVLNKAVLTVFKCGTGK